MSTCTLPASEIGRQHLGRPVAAEMPTSEGTEHAEGTLRWFAHHESDMVALGIEDPHTGITEEWQTLLETVVSVQVVPPAVTAIPEDSYVVLGWSEVDQPRIWMGRKFDTRAGAAEFGEETANRSTEWSGKPWAFAVARVTVIDDDPRDVPDEDTEGGAPDAG